MWQIATAKNRKEARFVFFFSFDYSFTFYYTYALLCVSNCFATEEEIPMVNPYPIGTTLHAWYNLAAAERNLILAVCRSLKIDAVVAYLAKRIT